MTNEEYISLFSQDDEQVFIEIVSKNLLEGAHRMREISAEEYVNQCRSHWVDCETDEVFQVKILIDTILQDSRPSKLDNLTKGMERIDLNPSTEDLYCIAIGLIRPDGSYVGASEGYENRPKNPKTKRGVAVQMPSDVPAEESDSPTVETYLLAFLDVLGFEKKLKDIGVREMQVLYQRLIDIALEPYVAKNLWTPLLSPISKNEFVPGMLWLPIRYAYFSDTILLWIPYRQHLVQPFLGKCLEVFCEAINIDIPLRGAITAGEFVLHKKSNIYIGEPLVEAAKLEKAQDWIGVCLGVSVRSEKLRIPFDPRLVMLWDAPIKKDKEKENDKLLSGLVLDWPRRWREIHDQSPHDALNKLRASGFEKYYDNAIQFAQYSADNSDWFLNAMPPLPNKPDA